MKLLKPSDYSARIQENYIRRDSGITIYRPDGSIRQLVYRDGEHVVYERNNQGDEWTHHWRDQTKKRISRSEQ